MAFFFLNSNGVGRTGAFLAMYSQMERLKNDGEADIFQYIKAVRIQRAGLILDVVSDMLGCQILFFMILKRKKVPHETLKV